MDVVGTQIKHNRTVADDFCWSLSTRKGQTTAKSDDEKPTGKWELLTTWEAEMEDVCVVGGRLGVTKEEAHQTTWNRHVRGRQ